MAKSDFVTGFQLGNKVVSDWNTAKRQRRLDEVEEQRHQDGLAKDLKIEQRNERKYKILQQQKQNALNLTAGHYQTQQKQKEDALKLTAGHYQTQQKQKEDALKLAAGHYQTQQKQKEDALKLAAGHYQTQQKQKEDALKLTAEHYQTEQEQKKIEQDMAQMKQRVTARLIRDDGGEIIGYKAENMSDLYELEEVTKLNIEHLVNNQPGFERDSMLLMDMIDGKPRAGIWAGRLGQKESAALQRIFPSSFLKGIGDKFARDKLVNGVNLRGGTVINKRLAGYVKSPDGKGIIIVKDVVVEKDGKEYIIQEPATVNQSSFQNDDLQVLSVETIVNKIRAANLVLNIFKNNPELTGRLRGIMKLQGDYASNKGRLVVTPTGQVWDTVDGHFVDDEDNISPEEVQKKIAAMKKLKQDIEDKAYTTQQNKNKELWAQQNAQQSMNLNRPKSDLIKTRGRKYRRDNRLAQPKSDPIKTRGRKYGRDNR